MTRGKRGGGSGNNFKKKPPMKTADFRQNSAANRALQIKSGVNPNKLSGSTSTKTDTSTSTEPTRAQRLQKVKGMLDAANEAVGNLKSPGQGWDPTSTPIGEGKRGKQNYDPWRSFTSESGSANDNGP